MARPRWADGPSFIRPPSMKRSPTVIASSPAISRSNVDLPHPDGPTRTTNSRSFTARSMLLSTSTWAKRLPRPRALSSLMAGASLHGPLGQAADELPLEGEEGDQDRDDRDHQPGHQHGPVVAQRVGEAHHADGDGLDALALHEGEREDELVPHPHRLDQRRRGEDRPAERQVDMAEGPDRAGAIHHRSLAEVGRYLHH